VSILPPQQGTGEAKELQFAHGVVAAAFFDLIFGERPKTGAAPEKLANKHSKQTYFPSMHPNALLSSPPALSMRGLQLGVGHM